MSTVGISTAEEALAPGDLPFWRQVEWQARFPWLVQGVTGAGEGSEPFDLGLFGDQPVGAVLQRWERLQDSLALRRAVHSRQVHGVELRAHGSGEEPGLQISRGYDGHLTRAPGLLLTVSVADCVPVFLVDARERAIAAVHAGWRGVAGGIVERAIDRLRAWGDHDDEIWLHCGPSICGECYEVGPEVHVAVEPEIPPPEGPRAIDLRGAIVRRALAKGVAPERCSVSAHCTRCGPGAFFSHRGGSAARQMGVIGIRG